MGNVVGGACGFNASVSRAIPPQMANRMDFPTHAGTTRRWNWKRTRASATISCCEQTIAGPNSTATMRVFTATTTGSRTPASVPCSTSPMVFWVSGRSVLTGLSEYGSQAGRKSVRLLRDSQRLYEALYRRHRFARQRRNSDQRTGRSSGLYRSGRSANRRPWRCRQRPRLTINSTCTPITRYSWVNVTRPSSPLTLSTSLIRVR